MGELMRALEPCIMYNNKPLEILKIFNYIDLKVPSNHSGNECTTYYSSEKESNFAHVIVLNLNVVSSRNTYSKLW